MAEQKPEPGAGSVEIDLAGKLVVLRPTLEACIALSRNGLSRMRERVQALDLDAMTEVIAAGMGVNPAQKQRLVAPAIYQTGMIKLSGPCILFLHAIANGGQIPQVSSTGQAIDALDEAIGYIVGKESLADQLAPLEAARAKLVEILEIESAEEQETEDPLAGSGSPSASSTAD